MNKITDRLDAILTDEFTKVIESNRLAKALSPDFADLRLYALYLIQTYHYTRHNPRHQALVVASDRDLLPGYARYCLRHAQEEWGHEMMAHHDLQKIGFKFDLDLWPKPLSETEALIAYLYKISQSGSPYARLGYTFWAERCYGFINMSLKSMASKLGLDSTAMTFLVAHSSIDEKHALEVEEVVSQFVRTPEDEAAVTEVMLTSLRLTVTMMDAVFDRFSELKEHGQDQDQILNEFYANV